MIRSYIKLISSMLIWGSLALFVQNVSFPSEQLVLFRVLLGLVFLLAIFFIRGRRFPAAELKKNGLKLILSGVFMGFNWLALFEAYRFADVSTATLCYYFAPVIVCIGSVIFFKEKMNLIKILSVIAALAGMFIVTGAAFSGLNPLKGVILALISAVLYSCVTLLNKSVKNMNGLDITLVQLFAAFAVMLPYVLSRQGFSAPENAADIFYTLILGFVHTGFALYMYFSAVQELPAQTLALFSYIDPVSALVFAAAFLGDRLTLLQIAGALLIIGGAAMPQIAELRRKKSLNSSNC